MKKVLAIALLFSISSVRAMDPMMEKCMKMCMVPAACMMMQKMMCQDKDICPMVKRSAADSSLTVNDITNKLTGGSIQAVLQRAFSPFGQTYSNDWQSVAVDSVVNAAVTEADSRLGISALNPQLQDAVSNPVGKLVYVSILNALAKAAYSYALSKVPVAAVVAKK